MPLIADAAESIVAPEVGGRVSGASSRSDLNQKLIALTTLTTVALRAEWRRLYRSQPPRLSRDLLVRGIAYRLQEHALGGIRKATQRKLAGFARQLEADGRLAARTVPALRPGARVVREWRGQHHVVAVLEDGFAYDGKTYASLTQIAEVITGAHWSGPRFFGLHDRTDPNTPSDGSIGPAPSASRARP